jgi:hypothetical protein
VEAQVLADVSDQSHGSGDVLVECQGGGVFIFHALSISQDAEKRKGFFFFL